MMNKLGPDGLVPVLTSTENGVTYGPYETIESEMIRERAKRDAVSTGPVPFVSEVGPRLWKRATTEERDAIVETIREMDTQAHTRHPNYKWPVLAGRSDRLPVITGWQCDVSCPACAVEAFRRDLLAKLGVKDA